MTQNRTDQPATPPNTYQVNPQQVNPTNTAPQSSSQATDTLGIISIIMAFVGLPPVGIILGIIGMKNAKRDNRSVKLSKVGLIINIVLFVITLLFVVSIVFSVFSPQQEINPDLYI